MSRLKDVLMCPLFLFYFLAIPLVENNTYLTQIEYSPLIGGFAVVLNDGRAAVLTAVSLKFDPNVSSWLKNYQLFFTNP